MKFIYFSTDSVDAVILPVHLKSVVYFFQDWIVNTMLNLLKMTMTYLRLEPETLGVAVSIPNHYTIEVVFNDFLV
jgi:hypothetical protein